MMVPLQEYEVGVWTALIFTGISLLLGLLQFIKKFPRHGEGKPIYWGKLPVAFMAVSAGQLLMVYIVRSNLAGFFALTNMYESLLAVALGMQVVCVFLFTLEKRYWQHPILLVLVQSMALGYLYWAMSLNSAIEPLQPSLVSYWRAIHVPIIMLSYSLLFLSAIGAGLYLWQLKTAKKTESGLISETTQTTLDVYDNWTFACVQWAFPLLTIGIALGAVWANEAWGTYWNWDPKEAMALATLLIFGAYWHLRLQERASKVALQWIVILGLAVLLITYFGINLMGVGLHSYGRF
jgi:cytochrome c-type biogenesis protein CcsB